MHATLWDRLAVNPPYLAPKLSELAYPSDSLKYIRLSILIKIQPRMHAACHHKHAGIYAGTLTLLTAYSFLEYYRSTMREYLITRTYFRAETAASGAACMNALAVIAAQGGSHLCELIYTHGSTKPLHGK